MPRSILRLATRCTAVLALATLLGCSTPTPLPPAGPSLLRDALFAPATPVPEPPAVFALSDPMRDFAASEFSDLRRLADPRTALIHALYRSRLQLAYDASVTRNAAEAFEARAGNCLSLVIMTAAFARHLGLPVSFQAVLTDEFYSRSGTLTLASGHVNLVLTPQVTSRAAFARGDDTALTIDFLPQDELRGQIVRPVDEATIVAMYYNNRAAELLAAGRLAEAYWHVRAALRHAPEFASAANTLGVIYNRAGHTDAAEAAYRHTLNHEPQSTSALSNLVRLLDRQGRLAESAALAARLAALQPLPPFEQFNLGRDALTAGDAQQALRHFQRELRLQPYQDEVHFWTAQAYWQLGRPDDAARHLARALSYSPTPGSHDRYAAKLAWLRQHRLQ